MMVTSALAAPQDERRDARTHTHTSDYTYSHHTQVYEERERERRRRRRRVVRINKWALILLLDVTRVNTVIA